MFKNIKNSCNTYVINTKELIVGKACLPQHKIEHTC